MECGSVAEMSRFVKSEARCENHSGIQFPFDFRITEAYKCILTLVRAFVPRLVSRALQGDFVSTGINERGLHYHTQYPDHETRPHRLDIQPFLSDFQTLAWLKKRFYMGNCKLT